MQYRIEEIAKRTGMTRRTLRYYEDQGLLAPPVRSSGGFRLYSEEDVVMVNRIKELRETMGFNLGEVRQILELERIVDYLREHCREMPPGQRLEQLNGAMRDAQALLQLVDEKVQSINKLREFWEHKMEKYRVYHRELLELLKKE
ncbi:MAG: MerR family transcriptional regulator [Peptococcaceae bacterium]|nr:MerR family transcriptional regulator [Peptococcaceae bacterium]